MRRRSSGSEEDGLEDPLVPEPRSSFNDDRKRSFTTAKFDVIRHSDTLDRRKVEKALAPARLMHNDWAQDAKSYEELSRQKLDSPITTQRASPTKKLEMGEIRRARPRSPWRISLLTLVTTAIAIFVLY